MLLNGCLLSSCVSSVLPSFLSAFCQRASGQRVAVRQRRKGKPGRGGPDGEAPNGPSQSSSTPATNVWSACFALFHIRSDTRALATPPPSGARLGWKGGGCGRQVSHSLFLPGLPAPIHPSIHPLIHPFIHPSIRSPSML